LSCRPSRALLLSLSLSSLRAGSLVLLFVHVLRPCSPSPRQVRSVGNLSADVPGIEAAGAVDPLLGASAMRHYSSQREACTPAVFVEAMRAERARDPAAAFYLAADSAATLRTITEALAVDDGASGGGGGGSSGGGGGAATADMTSGGGGAVGAAAGGGGRGPLVLTLAHPLVAQCDGPDRRGVACQQVRVVAYVLAVA